MTTPEVVAQAVVRAIKTDAPEIIVDRSAPLIRALLALAELSPSLAETLAARLGVTGTSQR